MILFTLKKYFFLEVVYFLKVGPRKKLKFVFSFAKNYRSRGCGLSEFDFHTWDGQLEGVKALG